MSLVMDALPAQFTTLLAGMPKGARDCVTARVKAVGQDGLDDFLRNFMLAMGMVAAAKPVEPSQVPLPQLPEMLGKDIDTTGMPESTNIIDLRSPTHGTSEGGLSGGGASGSGHPPASIVDTYKGTTGGRSGPAESTPLTSWASGGTQSYDADRYAMDRASVRSYDANGHLHVERTPLTRANVCEYLGSEIPDEDGSLRLDPQKIYRLYRDPEELAKSIPSFAGSPILLKHVPISADDHPRNLTVGSIGSVIAFGGKENDFIEGSITIWDKEGIDGINNGSLKDLSWAYRYKPVMERGTTPRGEPYDGRMTNMTSNHLALVRDGRVEGAYVADSNEEIHWKLIENALLFMS